MKFSRQEYWSGLLCPSPGDLPYPEIKPRPPALQADSLPSELPGKALYNWWETLYFHCSPFLAPKHINLYTFIYFTIETTLEWNAYFLSFSYVRLSSFWAGISVVIYLAWYHQVLALGMVYNSCSLKCWLNIEETKLSDTRIEPITLTSLVGTSNHLLLSCFSRVRLCATPEITAHQAPPSLEFSRQEHWSGLSFPSPMHGSEKWKWSRSVVSDSQRPHGLQPTRPLHPWDLPGKSTGVGCHCLLRLTIYIQPYENPLPWQRRSILRWLWAVVSCFALPALNTWGEDLKNDLPAKPDSTSYYPSLEPYV